MSDDIKGFIVELDLYTRPIAVVGCGMGAAVALQLAQRCPELVRKGGGHMRLRLRLRLRLRVCGSVEG
jgi:hypothetical protein